MSRLDVSDGPLHHDDASHRWIAPPGVSQAAWDAGMRAHLAAHRLGMRDGPEVKAPAGALRRAS